MAITVAPLIALISPFANAQSNDRIWMALSAVELAHDPYGLRDAAVRALGMELKKATTSGDAAKIQSVIEGARQFASDLRQVQRPSDIFRVLETPIARKYGIALYMADIANVDKRKLPLELRSDLLSHVTDGMVDPSSAYVSLATLTLGGSQAREAARQLADAVLGVSPAVNQQDLEKKLNLIKSSKLNQIVLDIASDSVTLGNAIPAVRAQIKSDIEAATQTAVTILESKVVPANTQLLFSAVPQAEMLWKSASSGRNAEAASALVGLAALTEDPALVSAATNLKRNVDAFNTVRAAVDLYTAGSTGGAVLALTALSAGLGSISSSSALTGEKDTSAAVLGAIAQLAYEMRRQFSVVNSKLDALASDLVNVHEQLDQILNGVADMNAQLSAVRQTLSRIDQRLSGIESRLQSVEQGIARLADIPLKQCLDNAMTTPPTPRTQVDFNNCISIIRQRATDLETDSQSLPANALALLATYFSDEPSALATAPTSARALLAGHLAAFPTEAAPAAAFGALPDVSIWQFLSNSLILLVDTYPPLAANASAIVAPTADQLILVADRHISALRALAAGPKRDSFETLARLFSNYDRALSRLGSGLEQIQQTADERFLSDIQNETITKPLATRPALFPLVGNCPVGNLTPAVNITLDTTAVYASIPDSERLQTPIGWRYTVGPTQDKPAPFFNSSVSVCFDFLNRKAHNAPAFIGEVRAVIKVFVGTKLVDSYPYHYYGYLDSSYDWPKHLNSFVNNGQEQDDRGLTPRQAIQKSVALAIRQPRVIGAHQDALISALRLNPLEHVVIEYRARQAELLLQPSYTVQVLKDPGTARETVPVDALLDEVDQALALLRAHLVIAIPEIYLRSEALRLALFGDEATRLVDGSFVRSWAKCARRIKQQFDNGSNHPSAAASSTQNGIPDAQRDCSRGVLKMLAGVDAEIAGEQKEYSVRHGDFMALIANPPYAPFRNVSQPFNLTRGTLVTPASRAYAARDVLRAFDYASLDEEPYPAVALTRARLATLRP